MAAFTDIQKAADLLTASYIQNPDKEKPDWVQKDLEVDKALEKVKQEQESNKNM